MNGPAARASITGERWWIGILLVFASTRLVVASLYTLDPGSGDQVQYVRSATSILDHGWHAYFDPGFALQPGDSYPYVSGEVALPDGRYNPIFWDPLYPLFLAAVFTLFGPSLAAVVIVQLAISLATLLIGIDTVRRMFPEHARAPAWFGWMFVAYLPLAGYATKILSETLDAFLLSAIVWVAVQLPRGTRRWFFAFGVVLGLYASIRSYCLTLVPVLLLWCAFLLVRSTPTRVSARAAAERVALASLGVALLLAPSYVRNHQITGGAWLLSTKGAWNLWKDNNHFPIENHDWRELGAMPVVNRWLQLYHDTGSAQRASRESGLELVRPPCRAPLPELYACEQKAALAYGLESPLRFARRALAKDANLWTPNDYIFNRAPSGPRAWHQNYRAELPVPLRYALQLWVIGSYLLAMMLCFLGITAPSPPGSPHRFVQGIVVAYLAFMTFVVTPWGHGVSRFRLPLVVPILMFAAIGLARVRTAGWSAAIGPAQGCTAFAIRLALALALVAVCAVKLPVLLAP